MWLRRVGPTSPTGEIKRLAPESASTSAYGDQAVDDNTTSDWSVLDAYIVEDFVEGELLGIPATNREVETAGIAIHRIRDGKIVEYWSVVDVARVLQQVGALPGPTG